MPGKELGIGADDRIEDPNGEGPRIWFQVVPGKESIKNRIHIDVNASGGRGSPFGTRSEQGEAEAARVESLGAMRLHKMSTSPKGSRPSRSATTKRQTLRLVLHPK